MKLFNFTIPMFIICKSIPWDNLLVEWRVSVYALITMIYLTLVVFTWRKNKCSSSVIVRQSMGIVAVVYVLFPVKLPSLFDMIVCFSLVIIFIWTLVWEKKCSKSQQKSTDENTLKRDS